MSLPDKPDFPIGAAYKFDSAEEDDPTDTFYTFTKEGSWFWEDPVWGAHVGPFITEAEAASSGQKELRPDGTHFYCGGLP
jgi:hypothetical protein